VITVTVNGDAQDLDAAATVESVVEGLACGRRGVAVAVNSEVVARSAWGTTRLAPGDRIEVLRAAQGGC
jgi:sulfur carrier protein